MEQGEIFKSECGYRVCGGVYLDGPVIDSSPWFETIEEAEEYKRKKSEKEDRMRKACKKETGMDLDW